MTIDEEIAFERKLADYYKDNNLKNEAKEHEQRAEWLEELKALRNGLKIKCDSLNDALEKGKKIGYNKAIDDYKYLLAERLEAGRCVDEKFAYIDLCDIDEIAEQLKSGGVNA